MDRGEWVFMKKVSLRKKLIRLFWATSTIPILVLSFFSFYNISFALKKNTQELTSVSLMQMDNNLTIRLKAYEDLLFQIYTNDDVVAWIGQLNDDQDASVAKNQLRRYLRGLLNTKEYIKSITVITPKGLSITYNQLSAATYENSWMSSFSLSEEELYGKVSSDNQTHIFPTEYGTRFANEDYYLFHMAHRIIDYKNLNKENGIVIVSLDKEFLQSVCQVQGQDKEKSFNFIIDEAGRIISYREPEKIGKVLYGPQATPEERVEACKWFIRGEGIYEEQYTSIWLYHDDTLSWDLVNVMNQGSLMKNLNSQIYLIVALSLVLFMVTILLTLGVLDGLMDSVKTVVASMQSAREGNLKVRVQTDRKMPVEIETIAIQFNDMLEKLENALKKEKEAGKMQRLAELKAMEAQINPHFLYNTLDTINWMAIDKDEFDISNAINSLATILRYAIADSSREVFVRDEIDWLKKYIYLQQFRLKNNFTCNINVEPEVMEYRIHKLLLQPFVENAILHGFEGTKTNHILEVSVGRRLNQLKILIRDNGKGIEPARLDRIKKGIFLESEAVTHIGMENAITRLRMYYGDDVKIEINSFVGKGTEVVVWIPLENG